MNLSIIIPIYNAASYINTCLNSIIKQEWLPREYELVIVDDGSTDNSRQIIASWFKRLPIVLLTQENKKQAAARNKALDKASGEYILFIDIDDTLEPDMVKNLYRSIVNYDLVESGINKTFIGKKGEVINKVTELPIIKQAKNKKDLISLYFQANTECDVGLWNKMFRRKIIEQNHLRFTNANFYEDSLFIAQYLNSVEYSRIRIIEQPLYNFYKRQGSTTSAFHYEIDQLSKTYLMKCKQLLKETQLNDVEQKKLIISLNMRVWIYTIHHHIKYDLKWDSKKQRDYLLHKIGFLNSVQAKVPVKYRIAFFGMYFFPFGYNKLYRNKYI